MKRAIALIELIFAIVIISITLMSVPNLISKTTKASNNAITQEAISNASSYLSMIMASFWDENAVDPKRGNPILVVEQNTTGLSEKEENITMPGGGGVPGGTMPGGGGAPAGGVSAGSTLHSMIGLGSRAGTPISSSRRFAIDSAGNRFSATLNANLGSEGVDEEPDDIDDFNNRESNLTLTSQNVLAEEGDYKDTAIKLKTEVSYIDDTPSPNSFNKKTITFNNPFGNTKNISTNIKMITLTLTSDNDPNKKVVLRAFSCNIGSAKLRRKTF